MLEGLFVTVTGFSNYLNLAPFAIGARLICVKEPTNPYDDDAVKVIATDGRTVGYLANNAASKANGTLTASRIYDRVGKVFSVEVCFTTRTKVICLITETDCGMPAGLGDIK